MTTLDRFAATVLLRLLANVVVAPVTVELRLRPVLLSFSVSPMMLCRALLAAVCLISTGLGRIYSASQNSAS
jgi:hypothetical protein